MYNEFHKLYEDALSEYIESQGFSIKDFYKEIRSAFNEDENSDVAVFAKIMMATCDFDVFVMLMREQARIIQNKPMQNVSYEDFQDEEEGSGAFSSMGGAREAKSACRGQFKPSWHRSG